MDPRYIDNGQPMNYDPYGTPYEMMLHDQGIIKLREPQSNQILDFVFFFYFSAPSGGLSVGGIITKAGTSCAKGYAQAGIPGCALNVVTEVGEEIINGIFRPKKPPVKTSETQTQPPMMIPYNQTYIHPIQPQVYPHMQPPPPQYYNPCQPCPPCPQYQPYYPNQHHF